MKKIALSFCYLLFLSTIALAQTTEQSFYYSINGRVAKSSNVKKICVNYEIIGDKKEECFAVNGNKFNFRSNLIQPAAATISTDNAQIKPIKIFLGNTEFVFNITKAINFVTKPKLQTEFENLVIILLFTANSAKKMMCRV
jgi:hypothetical protein